MRKRMVFLLVVIMIASLFTGCGQNSDKTSEPSETADFSDRELIVGFPQGAVCLDPYSTYSGDDLQTYNQIYDYLVTKDENGKLVPSLAEKYEISPDGLTYTFYLRKGVKFTNGSEFKASDVKFSVERGMNSDFIGEGYIDVEGCEVIDDYTVKIHMKVPNVGFLERMTNYYGAMVSEEVANKYGEQFGKTVESVVGTGPYILKEWKPGELTVFEANPNYFKGEPDIKKFRFKSITDVNAAIIALQTGEIDLYFADIPGISLDAVAKNEKLNLVSYPSMIYKFVFMNCESGIFKDLNLRKAVAYAVDREKMNIVGTEGHGTIVDYPGNTDYAGNPGIKTWYDLDIEKAKQLVKEAGMEGKTVTIKTFATDDYPKIATSLQDDLSSIGLDAKVIQMERNAFYDETDKGDFEMGIARLWPVSKDMDEIMNCLFRSTNIGNTNYSRYANPAMDELLSKAAAEMDAEVRKELYAEVVKLITDDAVQIPLYYTSSSRAYSKDLVIEEGNVQYDMIYHFKWND